MRRSITILALLLAVTAFSIAPVMAPCDPGLEICKEIVCPTGEGYSDNYLYLDNGIPVYPVGTKLFWWIRIKVTTDVALSNVVVYDRLGAEFMVEGIYEGAIAPGTPEPPPTYAFDYEGKDTLVDPITYGQVVSANGATGTVDKGDMFRGTDGGLNIDGTFRIFWTGTSCKVHFKWTIGAMAAEETATIFLVISTDRNPAGHQEFTSCGTTFLNSGATVKGFIDVNGRLRQVSAEADPIQIKAVDV